MHPPPVYSSQVRNPLHGILRVWFRRARLLFARFCHGQEDLRRPAVILALLFLEGSDRRRRLVAVAPYALQSL
ncbi:hypothetical protein NMY22_g15247 [Coprinellus aureogranulatus]|nr:hypothetical protein NMY22_g15247 [Coprinellus aureogranulatus]